MTRTVLNAHPDIHIADEMPWLKDIMRHGYDENTTFSDIDNIRVFQGLLSKLDRWGNVVNLSHDFEPDLQAKGTLSLKEVLKVCCVDHHVQVWGNKTPQHTENIVTLLELFPDACFLIVTRDVRDVCLSWRKKWGKDMIWCAAKWAERMANGKENTDNLSQNRYLYMKFEDLISDTEETCVRICKFLDMPFSSRMLEHHKYTQKIVDGKINYGQPIKKGNFNKWKAELPIRTVKRIEEIACQTLKMLGYQLHYATCERPISFLERLHGIWNDCWAMLMVGNRFSRKNSFRDRLRAVRNQFYWRFLK